MMLKVHSIFEEVMVVEFYHVLLGKVAMVTKHPHEKVKKTMLEL